ncbi:ABC transporter substrate-binding protein [Halobellus clavatus]|jgi:multiple sugar transport system substrate-binding protein|uniref:ABC-type glycerol-3-phosphate transport system, substrate-binding protein n=1 Tax=Halobellus clavatus TaxID=660517 RepID=A0A1H3DBY6_9EURY|nr:extracellular solute-binding protein [Halobellus clavatus]SDX64032.1 ABC-type glycerol-3-phosphate transport system, substrate-binding protein [Halobellus clavatus]
MKMVRYLDTVSRRDALKAVGGASTVGIGALAGCSGNGGDDTETSGGGDSTTSSGTSASTDNGMPDLSGEDIHFITVAQVDNIQELWRSIASDFEDATGANMEVEFVTTGVSSLDRIIQLIQAGDPPEVSIQSFGEAMILRNRGVLTPLSGTYDRVAESLGDATDVVQNIIEVEGERWMLPFLHNISTFSYRSDLSDTVPDTWEKATQYAREVDQMDSDIRGTYVPIMTGSASTVRFLAWFWMNGGSITEWEDDRVRINMGDDPYRGRVIEMLNFFADRQQYSPPGEGSGWATTQNILQSEQAASTWYAGVRTKNAAIRNDRPFAEDIELVPGMPAKRRDDAAEGSAEGFVAYENANTEAAKAFIRYATNQEFVTNLLLELSPVQNIPSWPTVKQSDRYREGIFSTDLFQQGWTEEQFNSYQDEAFSKLTHKTVEAGTTEPPNPYTSVYYSEPIWNLQNDVLLNDENPADVIDGRIEELRQVAEDAQG